MVTSDWTSILQHISDLNHFIDEGMKILGIPGLSLAIVEKNQIVFSNGYGVKQLGTSDAVDADTCMKIGSISKSMTSLLMAKLIDEKRFKWGTKVCAVLKKFQLYDKKLTKHMQMKDLVSGGTGLPRQDYPALLNYKSPVFDQLLKIKPTHNPGVQFQYNNQLGTAAGYVMAHILSPHSDMRLAYYQIMQDKIFQPMNMMRTGFHPSDNFSYPHAYDISGQVRPLTLEDDQFTDYQAPSSGIWSTANDMAQYIICELKDGNKLFGKKNVLYRREKKMIVDNKVFYGYGWCIAQDENAPYLFHNGNTYGFTSNIMIFPKRAFGIILLSNIRTDERFIGFSEKVHELWTARTTHYAMDRINGHGCLKHKTSPQFTTDTEILDTFVGSFYNEALGKFVISKTSDLYTLIAPTHTNQLRTNNQGQLCFIHPPFDAMYLVPTQAGNFVLTEDNWTYEFTRL